MISKRIASISLMTLSGVLFVASIANAGVTTSGQDDATSLEEQLAVCLARFDLGCVRELQDQIRQRRDQSTSRPQDTAGAQSPDDASFEPELLDEDDLACDRTYRSMLLDFGIEVNCSSDIPGRAFVPIMWEQNRAGNGDIVDVCSANSLALFARFGLNWRDCPHSHAPADQASASPTGTLPAQDLDEEEEMGIAAAQPTPPRTQQPNRPSNRPTREQIRERREQLAAGGQRRPQRPSGRQDNGGRRNENAATSTRPERRHNNQRVQEANAGAERTTRPSSSAGQGRNRDATSLRLQRPMQKIFLQRQEAKNVDVQGHDFHIKVPRVTRELPIDGEQVVRIRGQLSHALRARHDDQYRYDIIMFADGQVIEFNETINRGGVIHFLRRSETVTRPGSQFLGDNYDLLRNGPVYVLDAIGRRISYVFTGEWEPAARLTALTVAQFVAENPTQTLASTRRPTRDR